MTPAEEWARCRPWIEAALATGPGFETIEDVERLIENGGYQVWFGRNAAVVTEISDFQRRKILVVQHGGGDLAELTDEIEPALCEWAKAQGCDGIMGIGRNGWKRVCEKMGYRMAYIAMIKDLQA